MNRVLLVLILFSASILVYQWRASGDAVGVAGLASNDTEAPAVSDEGEMPAIGLAPLASFDEVVLRPLFIDGRRPPPEVENVAEATPKPPVRPAVRPMVDLTAIVVIDNQQQAVFRTAGKKQGFQKLKVGEEIEDWTVSEIQSKQATLTQGGNEEVFLLREYKKIPLPVIPDQAPVQKNEPKEAGNTNSEATQPHKK